MLEKILKTIARFRMILPGQRIAVACSGGPDSTALLLILNDLSLQLGCTLSVCHFNYHLRGAESGEDEMFVRQLAEQLRIPIHIQGADVRASARSAHANLEGKARELRYGFFLSLVRTGVADRVAVGHTADDQAETVLQRLLRGSGTKGLAGIHPVIANQIIRPLIEIRRPELLEWLQARKQPWRVDSSNLDLRLNRNRIRNKLLPELAEFNPRIVEILADAAEIARDEEEFWRDYLPEILANCTSLEDGKVLIDIRRLRQTPVAVARRILRWAVGRAGRLPSPLQSGLEQDLAPMAGSQPKGIDFEQIQRLLRLAFEGTSGSGFSLPGKLEARKEFSHLIIQKGGETPEKDQAYLHRIKIPAKVDVPEIGSTFCFDLVLVGQGQERYNEKGTILLDRRLAEIPLTLRNWQPGDKYRPRGRDRRRNLKEIFQRNRISLRQRQRWPVVLAGNEIVWARGLEVAEGFSPPPLSREAILIEESSL